MSFIRTVRCPGIRDSSKWGRDRLCGPAALAAWAERTIFRRVTAHLFELDVHPAPPPPSPPPRRLHRRRPALGAGRAGAPAEPPRPRAGRATRRPLAGGRRRDRPPHGRG